jgi:hypothetical protein
MQLKTLGVSWVLAIGLVGGSLLTACNGDESAIPEPSAAGGAAGESHGSGGESHGAGSAECDAIGHLCHEADTGSGPASECHTTGHVGNPDACEDVFASCIDTCVPDSGGEAGGPAMVPAPYCQALGSLCHAADTGAGRAKECHDIGHSGDETECRAEFSGCVSFCLEALENHGEGGAGGEHAHAASGAGGEHTHAGSGAGGEHAHAASGAGGEHAHVEAGASAGGHAGN